MIIEPAATTTEQIKWQSSSTATTVARPITILFVCAKRHPATPIRKTPFGPQRGGLTLSTRSSLATANSGATTGSWRRVAKKPQRACRGVSISSAKRSPVTVCADRKELALFWKVLSLHGTFRGRDSDRGLIELLQGEALAGHGYSRPDRSHLPRPVGVISSRPQNRYKSHCRSVSG
jgi:hypothetical protein